MKIPLAYDSFLLNCTNHRQYIEWDTDMHPNLAVLGNSGSGKSYFLRLLLGYVSIYAGENAKAYVCCYKNELLKNTKAPRYWGYKDIIYGLEQFKLEFEERLKGNPCLDFRLLVIDEYISWLASMDKEAEKVRKIIAELAFMIRSKNMHLCLGCHRAMAADFAHGSRDCLNVIFLGSPSKESVRSFCSIEDSEIIESKERGEGYTIFDGQKPVAITVPTVQDMDKLSKAILKLVSD